MYVGAYFQKTRVYRCKITNQDVPCDITSDHIIAKSNR